MAEDSYGNTDRKNYTGTMGIENAYNIEDVNALTFEDSWGSARGNLYSTSAGDKIAGLSDNYKKASGENCLKVKDNSMVSAYYYYDMSSDFKCRYCPE